MTVNRRVAATLLVLTGLAAHPAIGRARFADYADVRQILAALTDVLPLELKPAGGPDAGAAWSQWIEKHDQEIRGRLERGDEETIVNWLLFGTTFTKRPRAFVDPSPNTDDRKRALPPAGSRDAELVAARANDLVAALASPGQDERRLFARGLFERQGYTFGTAQDRSTLSRHLVDLVARVAEERSRYARETEAVRQVADVSEQFALRSKLFRDRGLSTDTSLPPGYALELTLRRMMEGGAAKAGSIGRVAVIGPGLDFTDKAAGHDIYPQQTLQPFALIDSLLRLKLAPAAGVQVTTLDVSPRVNQHLLRARARAHGGSPYVLRLQLDAAVNWQPGLVDYWKALGDRIGSEMRSTGSAGGVPTAPAFLMREIRVRPDVTLRLIPEDLNVVAQRLDVRSFDLIVATNVFIYYDTLDQTLALANIEAMLRPGGFLLSNNSLLELPGSRMRSRGYLTVQYSDRTDDGDHIVWYERVPG